MLLNETTTSEKNVINRKQDQVCCMPRPFSKLIQFNDNSSKAPTKTYILKVPRRKAYSRLVRILRFFILFIQSVRGVKRVDLILVPLSDKFDVKSLFAVLFYSLRTNLELVSTPTEAISYVVCNFKTIELIISQNYELQSLLFEHSYLAVYGN